MSGFTPVYLGHSVGVILWNTNTANKVKKSNIKKKEVKFPYSDKNSEADKYSVMQSVTKEENTDVWLTKAGRLCSDKNCQSTRCYKNMSPRRPMCDKNCQ